MGKSEEVADVLIVGAGAAGAAFAWSIAETRMNIVCFEQGDWMDPAAYPAAGQDWEARAHRDFALCPNDRQRPEDYPVDDRDAPVRPAMFNAVGGSTITYAAHFPRFHPNDFRVRTLDGVAEDWPIDYHTLEPFYEENERMMGVAGLAGNPAYPPKRVQLPPVPLGRVGETLARGFNALGWHWWPSDSAIATREYQGRARCVHLGTCTSGCAQGAKASTDITYWPAAIRRGVRLLPRRRVCEITVNERGMADGVVYVGPDGVTRRQRAHVVVLACNGIGTPRLLLNSRSKLFPNGLANRSGQVGRNLMLHPYALVQGVFAERLGGYKGPPGCGLMSHEFYGSDPQRGFVRGYSFEILRGAGPVTIARWAAQAGVLPWGAAHHDTFDMIFDHTAGLLAICEDLPDPRNRVTLSQTLTDSSGIPAPEIHYTLSENSRRMLDHAVARATEVLEAAGAAMVTSEAPWSLAGWHLMGTARMGNDPETSVVNSWGRAHDVPNLFIVDGSIFVTSAGVNPTNTIQALALYIADAMKKRLANLFD
ncbi:MAG: GMC family oxidoreductase [Candidatus Dadabacteria bacterium]|nr:MAG: GMC family oxidoreductase [Candidatus Dadabacteria bacterium]